MCAGSVEMYVWVCAGGVEGSVCIAMGVRWGVEGVCA